jgi:1-acyl-sn-glycerol-3-phosphate acyltransferase
MLYWIIIRLVRLFFKVVYRNRVYGAENFPQGGAIIASNHVSFYDPPLIAISAPEDVHFLARGSLFKIPVFGALIRALNAHPVSGEAGDIKILKEMCALLEQGNKLILFPEGTRSKTGELTPFKPGISLLISRTGCKVIPTYVHGTFEIWNRFRSFPKLRGKTACLFGKPIGWDQFAHLDKRAAHEAFATELARAIQELKESYVAKNERKS